MAGRCSWTKSENSIRTFNRSYCAPSNAPRSVGWAVTNASPSTYASSPLRGVDLDKEVQEGRFRDDLFFRLAVARVELPPLRTRRGDVAVLARHFWRTLGGAGVLPYEQLQRFESYGWPGNVRELRNAIARHIAIGDLPREDEEDAGDLAAAGASAQVREMPRAVDSSEPMARVLAMNLAYPRARERLLREFERCYVERVLAQHDGNVTHAARASGIARRYFNVILSRQSKA